MNAKEVLEEVLQEIKPDEKEIKEIEEYIKDFTKKFNSQTKKLKINAESFVGGSFAKKTVIKKDSYDVDIFVRFDKLYKDEEISGLTEKILKGFVKKFEKIHGSRDYFKINISDKFYIELIPVIKIKNPKEARNITDLSYFHVNYMKKKKKNLLDDIRLVKAFCYANRCYGAESYIMGFSGYSLELLTYHFGGFLNFLKAVAKSSGRIFVDMEKHYKSKKIISMDLNSAKLKSPIILIDPTFRQRNAAAALSQETFDILRDAAQKFLKNPNKKAFEKERYDIEGIRKNAQKNKSDFVHIIAETDKQEGDIAGSKLLKFYRHISNETEGNFIIKKRIFSYNDKKSAEYVFSGKSRNELTIEGPPLSNESAVKKFKSVHRSTFTKNKRIFAREKIKKNMKEFIEEWIKKNSRKIKEMSITKIEIID
jgi:tRNA nucleotidyltransferase (CCA-adding enzyme)